MVPDGKKRQNKIHNTKIRTNSYNQNIIYIILPDPVNDSIWIVLLICAYKTVETVFSNQCGIVIFLKPSKLRD